MQLAAEIVAAGAFEHRGLMPPVALRAFDLSEMGIVGIDFEAVCLLGKFFVASAVAGQTLLFFDRRGGAPRPRGRIHTSIRARYGGPRDSGRLPGILQPPWRRPREIRARASRSFSSSFSPKVLQSAASLLPG